VIGINKGQVVGYAASASPAYHALVWQNGTMTDVGTLGGSDSYTHGINDAGQIVGQARFAS
jgi:probable HAF family extracellular repeat protein